MIQFLDQLNPDPSCGIPGCKNVLGERAELYTQIISVRHEQVDRVMAGYEKYYCDVGIEGSAIFSAYSNGITVSETTSPRTANDTVVCNACFDGKAKNASLWTSQIGVPADHMGIMRNVTVEIARDRAQFDWRYEDNVIHQSGAWLRLGNYRIVSTNNPEDLLPLFDFPVSTLDLEMACLRTLLARQVD